MATTKQIRTLTYCSFATATECLGVVVLRGDMDVVVASGKCHEKGINPGGQVLSMPITEIDCPMPIFDAMWNNCDRLIPKDEAIRLFDAVRLGDADSN